MNVLSNHQVLDSICAEDYLYQPKNHCEEYEERQEHLIGIVTAEDANFIEVNICVDVCRSHQVREHVKNKNSFNTHKKLPKSKYPQHKGWAPYGRESIQNFFPRSHFNCKVLSCIRAVYNLLPVKRPFLTVVVQVGLPFNSVKDDKRNACCKHRYPYHYVQGTFVDLITLVTDILIGRAFDRCDWRGLRIHCLGKHPKPLLWAKSESC